jgi:ribonucleoside-diphosphate reductase alpha chain
MSEMYVLKTNETKESFDIQKIRIQINKAYEGLELNPLELEAKISLSLKLINKSADIQQLLITTALSMISLDMPEMAIVAGRLAMNQLHREVYKNTKIDHSQFKDYIKYAEKQGWYRKDFSPLYSDTDIAYFQSLFNSKYDYSMDIAQVLSLKSKYLIKSKKGIVEYPQFSDMASSMILSSIETDKTKHVKEYFEMLSKTLISLATPFKSNLRRENGNTGSCFIIPIDDNIESITKTWQDMSYISKEGGGLGVYLGYLRPEGSWSQNIPKANNVTKWAKIINDIAVAVNQRGVRKGAITPAIDWWHMDVYDFIEIKTETETDLRSKCFDLFPQVVVDKHFIKAVRANVSVWLFDQHELKVKFNIDIITQVGDKLLETHKFIAMQCEAGKLRGKKIEAKHLWKEMLRVWFETGDFYIAHKDNINMCNYLRAEDLIANSVNLCVESFSITKPAKNWDISVREGKVIQSSSDGIYHSCNLLSINAGLIFDDKTLKRVCRVAVRMLDASIDLGIMPVVEAKNSSEFLRNIGIGVLGTADWMAYNKLSYEKDADLLELEKFYEKVAYNCYEASVDLAVEKGSYPYYEKADYSTMFGKTPEELNKISPNGLDWVSLNYRMRTEGMRNFLLLATAPNTSSGMLMGATASYQPPQSKLGYQTLANLSVPIVPRYIKDRYWFYKGKYQYAAHKMIKVTAILQRWIDTGISMEVFINPESTNIKLISDAILEGFTDEELKAVYYSLSIDAKKDPGCTDCAN